jgi:hypothetical protein
LAPCHEPWEVLHWMCGVAVGVSGAADEPAREKARGDSNGCLCWRRTMMTKQETGIREQGFGGLRLVRKPVARQEAGMAEVREGSTGRVVSRIWAVAEGGGLPEAVRTPVSRCEKPRPEPARDPVGAAAGSPAAGVNPEPEVAFYRKYTEAMLRRYMRLSMEAGRVPSLMGRELFRGHVTSYKVKSFEDVVIFCYDVEKCLKVLDGRERELIKRIALQAYSHGEAAGILGLSLRSCIRYYYAALDKLTQQLLEQGLLKPLESCQ